MNKRPLSFAVRLSLRFMFILTTSVILLSLSILFFLRSLVKSNQEEGLVNAANGVFSVITRIQEKDELNHSENADELHPVVIPEIPYFISYIVYDSDTEEILATNDPFLPLLKDTKGKAKRYFAKNFFFDGDLDVVYYAESFVLHDKKIVVAVSENNEKNFLNMIFKKLPAALLFMIIPILIISFFVSLFITKNTISPVVKITKKARTMTTENLDGQLPLSGRGDEIDDLSKAFNELFLRIKADFDRERQFSSDVSHELNTPLTVISGQANLLLRWGKDNPAPLVGVRVVPTRVSRMGKEEQFIRFTGTTGTGTNLKCVDFTRTPENEEILRQREADGRPVTAVGYIEEDNWNGQSSLQLNIKSLMD